MTAFVETNQVFETSAEWPYMAAIVQERRQKAAEAFEARMSLQKKAGLGLGVGLTGGGSRGGGDMEDDVAAGSNVKPVRRVRIRSDPVSHRRTPSSGSGGSGGGGAGGGGGGSVAAVSSTYDKDSAKHAFRRRSISEDTYNRQPSGGGVGAVGEGGSTCQGTEGGSADHVPGGIICSNDDLRAIVYEHKHRRYSTLPSTYRILIHAHE